MSSKLVINTNDTSKPILTVNGGVKVTGALNVEGLVKLAEGTENIAYDDRLLTQKRLIDVYYPVGSIYQSFNSTAPNNFFGGTWESITCPYSGGYAWKRTA